MERGKTKIKKKIEVSKIFDRNEVVVSVTTQNTHEKWNLRRKEVK